MVVESQVINEERLGNFLGIVVQDLGAVLNSAMVLIGEQLGLYRAMADGEPVDSVRLAAKSGASERYLREWLVNQAAGGYIDYDDATNRYTLPPEQALVLAGTDGPVDVPGGFRFATSVIKSEQRLAETIRSGSGMSWGEHDHGMFEGTERFFRPIYRFNLVNHWIPALDGVDATLTAGAKVADIGCGYGASTVIMAQAFPNSRFYGYDFHEPSIERAREAAAQAGVADRVTFEVVDASAFPGTDYDLITYFDCFHDLPNPQNAARQARQALAPHGTVMVVEPMAGRSAQSNFNPVGRVFSAGSMLVCTPNALSNGPTALGAIATDAELKAALEAGGFTRFRRATETPFNRVFEVRP
jgi:2-polyprenyl-3-methyl-5-hydroxy-6-metoxy-1,4-benzoquinol methylase